MLWFFGSVPDRASFYSTEHYPHSLLFQKPFVWGTTTAAYQVEGGIANHWTDAGVDAGKAVRHWENFEQDLRSMQELNSNAYRFSISWARIEPEPGVWDTAALEAYRERIKSMHSAGIEPFVTLLHFTHPTWFEKRGGWRKADNIRYYLRFVHKILQELGSHVRFWNPINEPVVQAIMSHAVGKWPPFEKDLVSARRVLRHLLMAHAQAYALIHRVDKEAQVGLSKSMASFWPHWRWNPLDQLAANQLEQLYNLILWRNLSGKPGVRLRLLGLHVPSFQATADWVGVHYYAAYYVNWRAQLLGADSQPADFFNRLLYPRGLYQQLKRTQAWTQNLPLYVTENGLNDPQSNQLPHYLVHHLAQVWRAQNEGLPIKGYFVWTLMDNYEWTAAYKPRFGLLDRDRQWKPGAFVYRDIAQNSSFPASWLQRYPWPPQAPQQEHKAE